ncbi:MAG: hypothetical protein HY774_14525 [Acidobacteria bacterium]|nr:hypothetical protein [Acidobacteriota bacterium]
MTKPSLNNLVPAPYRAQIADGLIVPVGAPQSRLPHRLLSGALRAEARYSISENDFSSE